MVINDWAAEATASAHTSTHTPIEDYESAESGREDDHQSILSNKLLSTKNQTRLNTLLDHFKQQDTKDRDGNGNRLRKRSIEQSDLIIDKARDYQQELYERAKDENIIAVLDTGMGKTLIAVLLIRHMLKQEVFDRDQGKLPKTIFFLANSVSLVQQQARVLVNNLSTTIIDLHGDGPADLWNRSEWESILTKNKVVVCTAAVLYQALFHSYITIPQISLIVFDEAHHCKKNHPYSRIIRDFYLKSEEPRPRVFGMTASPVDSKRDVEKTIKELEELLSSKVLTTADTSLFAFAHRPVDQIWHYTQLGPEIETDLFRQLNTFRHLMPNLENEFILAKFVSMELGTWCADQLLRHVIGMSTMQASTTMKKFEQSQFYAQIGSLEQKELSKNVVRDAICLVQQRPLIPPELSQPIASSKLIKLHDGLMQHYAKNPETRAMVFVDRRWTAILLCDWLMSVAIPNLRPGVIVGAGNGGRSEPTSVRKQQEIMSQFRAGIINTIFATSVAEEGIDVAQCNLVVRFDLYKTTIQYIQSRGRARMKSSVYAHMIENGNFEQKAMMDYAVASANYLKAYCQNLPPDRLLGKGTKLAQQIARDASHHSFQTLSGAVCNFSNCLLILSRYASSLHHVGAMTTEVYEEEIVENPDNMFRYVVRLPTNESSWIKGARGDPRQNKALAKRSAAFACVRLLRGEGFLDENLDSIFKKSKPANLNAHLAVSEKKDSYEMNAKPNFWLRDVGTKPSALYASILKIKPSTALQRRLATLVLLTRQPLPRFPVFSIYLEENVESEVSLTNIETPLNVNERDLDLLNSHTLNAIFSDVFNKVYDLDSNKVSYWLVPAAETSSTSAKSLAQVVDIEALKQIQESRIKWNPDAPASVWCNKFLVDPWNGKYHYFSGNTATSINIFDPVPQGLRVEGKSAAKNIVDFTDSHWRGSKNKHFASNWDPKQSVYHAELLTVRRNFLDKGTDKEINRKFCLIAPQPLEIARITPEVAATALAWPSIIHRIESYMIALEAFDRMGLQEVPAELALEAFTKDSNTDDPDEQVHSGSSRGMGKNYERLEFIGDSLLKMMTTITVFNLTTCDEEGMHCRRMDILCNRRLFNVASGPLELYRYIRTCSFDRETWYPEHLVLLKGRGAQKVPAPVKHATKLHDLGMKTIADVCEASIGAAVVTTSNLPAEIRFDLGIKAITRLVESPDHNITSWAEARKMYVPPAWQLKNDDPWAIDLASKVAKSTGYNFRHPRLVRSAFTHSSVLNAPVPDFQRLEFLGDAVLDWVSIWWLFDSNPTRSPQWLTEHKMAMVSNKFLAALAVVLDFDKFIDTLTPMLIQSISEYSLAVREQLNKPNCPKDFWTRIDNPPKALADLVESTLGAILIDSDFDYTHIEKFFNRHILPFFEDINAYDTFANRHPTSYIHKKLTDEYGCSDFKIICTEPNDEEIEPVITAGVVVHEINVLATATGSSGKYAKVRASKAALEILDGLGVKEYREKYGCDCARGAELLKMEMERMAGREGNGIMNGALDT